MAAHVSTFLWFDKVLLAGTPGSYYPVCCLPLLTISLIFSLMLAHLARKVVHHYNQQH